MVDVLSSVTVPISVSSIDEDFSNSDMVHLLEAIEIYKQIGDSHGL